MGSSAVFERRRCGMFLERIGSNESWSNYNDLQWEILPWTETHQAIQ